MRLFNAGSRGNAEEVVHDRVLTAANLITAVRLLALPLFAWLLLGADRPAAAFWTLAAVASTDWLDGYVARRFDQVSRIGKVIDPLVDRIVVIVAGVTLGVAGIVPWLVIVALVARDAAILGGSFVLFGGVPPIAVTRVGKIATACLLAGLPSFLVATIPWAGAGVFAVVAVVLTGVGLVLYYVAGLQYVVLARRARHAPGTDAPRSS